jgi:hypothetical protein
MLTAYVDESGQDGHEDVVIAGYIGDDAAWDKFTTEWKAAIAPRQSLHMRELRWRGSRHKRLLARIGPIPDRCGLQRLVGGVRVEDYADLFPAPALKKSLAGYTVAMFPLLISVLKAIPEGEKIRIFFEQQDAFAQPRETVLRAISQLPCFNHRDGSSKLADWGALPKSTYFEPADALAYAALQDARDSKSDRAIMSAPILGDRMMIGRFMSKKAVRAWLELTKVALKSGVDPKHFLEEYASNL